MAHSAKGREEGRAACLTASPLPGREGGRAPSHRGQHVTRLRLLLLQQFAYWPHVAGAGCTAKWHTAMSGHLPHPPAHPTQSSFLHQLAVFSNPHASFHPPDVCGPTLESPPPTPTRTQCTVRPCPSQASRLGPPCWTLHPLPPLAALLPPAPFVASDTATCASDMPCARAPLSVHMPFPQPHCQGQLAGALAWCAGSSSRRLVTVCVACSLVVLAGTSAWQLACVACL